MNLRLQAEQDLALTLEDTENGFASDFVLISADGVEFSLKGIVGDIGFLFDSEGVPISGRSLVVSYRLSSLVNENGMYLKPNRGWTAKVSDLSGKQWKLYVTDFKPDRTIGIGVLNLSLELKND